MDAHIENEGTIFTLRPISDRAREWIEDNIESESYQWFGAALCIEHRFAHDIVSGMQADGLEVA